MIRATCYLAVLPFILACLMATPSRASEEGTNIVVAIVESSESKPPNLRVTFGSEKVEGTAAILRGFQTYPGKRLVLLVQDAVPLSSVGTLAVMASKAEWAPETIFVFVFPANRQGMWSIPGFRDLPFSAEPETFEKLLGAPAHVH